MLTTDLGACEWFVWDLRRSNLIDRGQLDQVIGEFLAKNAGAEPPALAAHLVKLGVLTDGFTRHGEHGHGLQGAVEERWPVLRRQGAAAAQHVERSYRSAKSS